MKNCLSYGRDQTHNLRYYFTVRCLWPLSHVNPLVHVLKIVRRPDPALPAINMGPTWLWSVFFVLIFVCLSVWFHPDSQGLTPAQGNSLKEKGPSSVCLKWMNEFCKADFKKGKRGRRVQLKGDRLRERVDWDWFGWQQEACLKMGGSKTMLDWQCGQLS